MLSYVVSFRRTASQKCFGVGQSTVSPRSRDRFCLCASSSISSRARRETNQLDDAPVMSGDEGDCRRLVSEVWALFVDGHQLPVYRARTATASGTAPATSAAGRGGICLSLPAPHRLRLRGHREDGVLRHELAENSEVPHTSYFDSSACAICAVSATCWRRTMRPSRIVQTCAKRALKVLPVVIARAVYVPRAKTRRVSSFSIAWRSLLMVPYSRTSPFRPPWATATMIESLWTSSPI